MPQSCSPDVHDGGPGLDIEFTGVTKRYGEVLVDAMDLSVRHGSFLTLLGSSG